MQSLDFNLPALVIAYGNTLRADDAVAAAIAGELRRLVSPRHAEILTVHQLTPELADRLTRSRLAIFIDADGQTPPGQVRVEPLSCGRQEPQSLGHQQSPENLLKMAQYLYGFAPPALLFHIGAADFSFHEGLSPNVREAVPRMAQEIFDAIEHQHAFVV